MTKLELSDRIKKEVEETLVLAEDLYERKFERIPISFKIRGKTAGYFKCKKFGENIENPELKFNLDLALLNEENFNQTVVHEVAHYVNAVMSETKPQSHGFEWKTIMKDLGKEPLTTHNYKIPPKPEKKEVVVREKKNLPIGEYKFPDPKSRDEAKESGDILYWNEEPDFACEKGHVAPRYVRDNMCKQCSQLLRVEKDRKRLEKLEADMRLKIESELKKAA